MTVSPSDIALFFAIIAVLAIPGAFIQRSRGYRFGRAYMMLFIAFTGLGLIVVKMFAG